MGDKKPLCKGRRILRGRYINARFCDQKRKKKHNGWKTYLCCVCVWEKETVAVCYGDEVTR